MFENIFEGILIVFAIVAVAFGWWIENGGSGSNKNSKEDKE